MKVRSQRGAVMIWVALMLLVTIGLTSLGIDMAKLMAAHTQLQNAADAAALAGASAIDPTTGLVRPDSAVVRSQQIGALNKAFVNEPTPVVIDPADVVVGTNTVKVTARREGGDAVVTYIAKVLGVTALELHADATAKAEPAGTVTCGVVPLAAVPPPAGVFLPGCGFTYVLKEASQGGTTGNYQALRYNLCPSGNCVGITVGAALYRCLMEYGMCCPVTIGQSVTTETGNMSGPTATAVQYRFDQDTDPRPNICYSDYRGNGSRVVTVPLTTLPGNGASQVTVTGFATFFLRDIPGSGKNSTITGEFINAIVPGIGGGPTAGVTAYSLRLIE